MIEIASSMSSRNGGSGTSMIARMPSTPTRQRDLAAHDAAAQRRRARSRAAVVVRRRPSSAFRPPARSAAAARATPASEYCFSLLRSVRIEMPRMFAACVRLPRQCVSVSRISSCSTSATVWPTKCARGGLAPLRSPRRGVVAASRRRARRRARGSRRRRSPRRWPAAPRGAWRFQARARCRASDAPALAPSASCESLRAGRPLARAYFSMKKCASAARSSWRSRSGGMRRFTTLRR